MTDDKFYVICILPQLKQRENDRKALASLWESVWADREKRPSHFRISCYQVIKVKQYDPYLCFAKGDTR